MAITGIMPAMPCKVLSGYDYPMDEYTDASGATYKVGAALIQSGGDLIEATSFTSTGGTLVGLAMQAGSNITGTHVAGSVGNAGVVTPLLYVPALDTVVFEATFGTGGGDVAIAATDLFVKYGFSKDATSGYWYVDKARTTTNAAVVVIGIKNKQDVTLGTTVGARVFFKFIRNSTYWSNAS